MAKIHALVGTVTAGGVDGDRISEGATTISNVGGAPAGATSLTATDPAKLTGLTKLMVGSGANREIVTIASIVGSTVNFTPALINAHAQNELLHYPFLWSLNANGGQEAIIKFALRCDVGNKTSGDVVTTLFHVVLATPDVDQTVKFAIALDNGTGVPGAFGAWGAGLTLINPIIGATNTLIHVKAKCLDGETLQSDISTKIKVDTSVVSA